MSKTILDPIHKQIIINPLAIQIINTIEFQRLRHLKQCGVVDYVFPGATHTRLEHSIGVYHLAGILLNQINKNQPELGLTTREILLVQIAGLCHDLGHSSWSHTFDHYIENVFEKLSIEEKIKIKNENPNVILNLRHERRSIVILDNIIKKNHIDITENEFKFIANLIDYNTFPNIEYQTSKKFLFHVISNPINSLDVDKLDYLLRDPYYIGLSYSFDYTRLFANAKVINDEIVYPWKSKSDVHDVFYYRIKLHREIYNHPVIKGIELMINDMFDLIFPSMESIIDLLNFGYYNNNCLEPIFLNSYQAFLSLVDNITNFFVINSKLNTIIDKHNQNNQNWKTKFDDLVSRINTRNLYQFVGEIDKKEIPIEYNKLTFNPEEVIKIIISRNPNLLTLRSIEEWLNILICYPSHIGYPSNPLSKVKFFNQKKLNLVKDDSQGLMGKEDSYRIYSRYHLTDEELRIN